MNQPGGKLGVRGGSVLRVTHVITRLIIGGAQENTVATVLGLAARGGFQVDLVSGPTTGPEGSLESVFAPHPGMLSVMPELVRPVAPWRDLVALVKLRRLFERTRPVIVHTHSGKAGILGRFAASWAGVPCVIHTIHGPSFGPFQGVAANQVFEVAERWAGRVTTHFVVVAEAMREQYLAAGIGKRSDYTVVRSGFDLSPFLGVRRDPALAKLLGIGVGDFVVGTVARLAPLKGHGALLAVAPGILRKIPGARFLLVGDGPLRAELEAEVAARGLGQAVIFAGRVPPSAVAGLIGQMDVLVHLSEREGLARALPQALAAGVPVVAFDCDGAGEVCRDGRTGYLLANGDLDGLSARLLMLAGDRELRVRLGNTGREEVRERFGVERMVGDLVELYARLVAGGVGGGG